ncbi:MAG TPA: ATP-binding cassette domain-containing protein, partial [Acetobacteraceae bacterium]
GLSVPLAFGILGDAIIPRSDLPALATLGGALLAAAFGAASVEVSRGLLLQRMEARAMHDTQAALLDRLLRLPADFFRRFGSADLADRILIIDLVRRSLTGARLNGAIAGLLALGNVVVMLACNLPLGLLGTMLALVAGGFGLRLCVPQARIERRQAEDRGRTVNLTLEAISGVAKLKVAAATDRVLALWLRAYGRQHRSFIAARRITTWQAVFLTAFLPLAMIALFLLAAPVDLAAGLRDAQVMGGPSGDDAGSPASSRFSLGAWLAFSCAFGQLMAGIGQMLPAVSGSVAAVPVHARAKPILEAPLESRAGYKPPSVLSGAIEFSHVSFTYAATDALVLPELSFNIRPGEFVAIVGPSGGGKSTILRLLLGFETPGSGAVLYDGRPLATLDVAAVRRQIGAVLQNGRLQAGSILDNIGGDRPIELGEAWSAVELAGLAPDIRALPMGMYTMLSEAGGTLSGGQRQRLLIARALARRPCVLLLDEATSALDNRTQSVVAEAVASLGLTRLVVAHRLSTIAAADRILVLCQGRLVQMGRYGELMAEPGLFRDMAERQSA